MVSQVTFTEFPIPQAQGGLGDITAGPDGNLWFINAVNNQIGRITPSGAITEFAIPTANSLPWAITAGPDGNLWFTEGEGNQIGRITIDTDAPY
jgi:virginiamycin B lyase